MKVEIPKVLKFFGGEMVIALVDDKVQFHKESHIEVSYPIKVITEIHSEGERTVERFSLQPWIAITDSMTMPISTSNISTVVTLGEGYEEGYKRMVQHLFFSTEEDDIIESETDTVDLLMEYYEAKKQNKVN